MAVVINMHETFICHVMIMSVLCTPLQVKCNQTFLWGKNECPFKEVLVLMHQVCQ